MYERLTSLKDSHLHESGVWVLREAVRAISDYLKRGTFKAGRGGRMVAYNKAKKVYAAAQCTMLTVKLRKLLLIKSVPGC